MQINVCIFSEKWINFVDISGTRVSTLGSFGTPDTTFNDSVASTESVKRKRSISGETQDASIGTPLKKYKTDLGEFWYSSELISINFFKS